MPSIDRHQLHFGPYQTPVFQYGETAACLIHGDVIITGISDGRIAWPMTTRQGGRSLLLYQDLVQAVEREAACAVAYWFGVSTWMVRKWRRILSVPARNQGDRLLKREYAAGENGRLARQAALLTANDRERCAKISAAQRGKPRPTHVIEAIRQTMTGRKLTPEHRAKVVPYLKRLNAASSDALALEAELSDLFDSGVIQVPLAVDTPTVLTLGFANPSLNQAYSSA